jgi:protein-disulfide isomerase
MNNRLERGLSILLTLSTMTVAATYVRREWMRARVASAETVARTEPARKPSRIDGWEAAVSGGIRLGSDHARVTIIELMDFECPFCGRLAVATDSLLREYPEDVAVVVHHFPLPNHKFARRSAVASECAQAQGAFKPFYTLLFANQDSIGIRDWKAFARDAGVADLKAFEECRTLRTTFPRIDEGIRLGLRLEVRGTPTVLINGWLLPNPPRLALLRKSVQAVLAGKEPVDS